MDGITQDFKSQCRDDTTQNKNLHPVMLNLTRYLVGLFLLFLWLGALAYIKIKGD